MALFYRGRRLWLAALFAFGSLTAPAWAVSFSGNGNFGGNTWTSTASVTDLGGGSYHVHVECTRSGGVVAGVQGFASDSGAWGSGSAFSYSIYSGASGSSTWDFDVGTDATHTHVWVDLFGQDTATDPAGSNNKQVYQQIAGGATFHLTVHLPANTTDHNISYSIKQDGVEIAVTSQFAGDPARDFDLVGLANNHAVTVEEITGGIVMDTNGSFTTFHTDPAGSYVRTVFMGTPSDSGSAPTYGTATAPTVDNSGEAGGGVAAPGTTSAVGVTRNVYSPASNVAAASGSSSDMSISAYREGVDKLTQRMVADTASLNSGISALGTKLDTANGHLSEIQGDLDAIKQDVHTQNQVNSDIEAAKAANPGPDQMASSGAAAKANVEGLFPAIPDRAEVSPGSMPNLEIALPARFGGARFNLNPFSPDRFGPLAAWHRTAMTWLSLAILGTWIWSQLGEWVRGFSSIRQAQGNAVVGGTGAQATALAAAGVMTTTIIVATTALLSWSFGDIGLSAIRGIIAVNPLGTMASGSLWMLDQWIPVGMVVGCLLARFTFNMYAAPVFAGCAAVIRFVVP